MNLKKSIYNLISGVLGQLIIIIIGMIVPRYMILILGSEVNGFINSIGQIFAYFGLLEAGVGTATWRALYGPCAKNDKKSISAIMAATNTYYKKTGKIFAALMLVFAVVYPFVVDSSISKVVIVLAILLQGLSSVITYFYHGKYLLLLQAEGKNYIQQTVVTIMNIFIGLSKLALLYMGCNVVAIQSVYLIANILQCVYIMRYIKKHYEWIDLEVKPDYVAISQKNSVMFHQIASLVFYNVDVVILTLMKGLQSVSIYAMYNMIYNYLLQFLDKLSKSVTFMLGQAFNVDKKKFLKMQDIYEVYCMATVFAVYTVAYKMTLPFIELYTKGADINYIFDRLPFWFVVINLLNCGRITSNQVITFAGKYKETQSHAVIETVINIVVSIVGVHFLGVEGVLIGTVVSLFVRTNLMIYYANRKIIDRSVWPTYRRWITNFVLAFVIVIVWNRIDIKIDNWFEIFLVAIISGIIILGIFVVVDSVIDYKCFVLAWKKVRGILFKKIPKSEKYIRKIEPYGKKIFDALEKCGNGINEKMTKFSEFIKNKFVKK